ncbi:MAG: restriction endonuclease subunit S [Methanobacteriaceae archaeon]
MFPILRFKEFKDEWVEKKLGDICDVRDGTHSSPKFLKKGVPLITSKNLMKNGSINFEDVKLISEEDYIDINRRSLVNIGDILFGMIGTIGNPVVVNDEGFAIKNVALIKEKKLIKNNFLIYILQSSIISKQFYRLNTGGTQKFVALGIIRELKINVPSLEEQEKIANFLVLIDKKIELLEKSYSLYESIKKITQKKIFNCEYNFEDFNQHHMWRRIVLSELIESSSSNLSINQLEENHGKYPLFGAQGFIKNISFYEKDKDYIAIVKDGAGVGRTFILPKKSSILGTLHYLSLKDDTNNNLKFIYYLISTINFKKYIVGSTIPHIYFKDYSKIKIKIPNKKEQDKIAEFLSFIDSKIEIVELEIKNFEMVKKGLLQKMFI